MTMTIPVWALLAFAGWTLLTLMASIGPYRWAMILSRRQEIRAFGAPDIVEGHAWYRRAMRAHANCVENLPVFGAIVVAIVVSGAQSSILDTLAVVLVAARVIHTLVHILLEQTNVVVSVRFVFFFVQFICMIGMGGFVAWNA